MGTITQSSTSLLRRSKIAGGGDLMSWSEDRKNPLDGSTTRTMSGYSRPILLTGICALVYLLDGLIHFRARAACA